MVWSLSFSKGFFKKGLTSVCFHWPAGEKKNGNDVHYGMMFLTCQQSFKFLEEFGSGGWGGEIGGPMWSEGWRAASILTASGPVLVSHTFL